MSEWLHANCRRQHGEKQPLLLKRYVRPLQVTWLLTFRPEGGGAPGEMGIRACAWEKLMRGISEPSGWVTEWSIQRGKDSCSRTQGQIERAGPWDVERTVKTGPKVWQSQGMLWASDNRTVEGRQGSGLAGQGGKSPYFSRHLFYFPKGIWANGMEENRKKEIEKHGVRKKEWNRK